MGLFYTHMLGNMSDLQYNDNTENKKAHTMKRKLKKYICGYHNTEGNTQLIATKDSEKVVRLILRANKYSVVSVDEMDSYRLITTTIPYKSFNEGEQKPPFFD